MSCPRCGAGTVDGWRCDDCGAELAADGGADFEEPVGPPSVPSDAVAVDVACPHCGRNPIESVARGYRVTGMLLAYQRKTLRVVGCQSCIRKKLLVAAVKNLLLGWWGVRAALTNLFAVPWNVARAFVSRGPNENLVAALEESGIPFGFVREGEEWDPLDHDDVELYVDGLVRLACAVMEADGSASAVERETVVEVAGEVFPDHSTEEVAETVEEYSGDDVDVLGVSEGLAPLLTDEGKQLALNFVLAVASADDEVTDSEVEVVEEVAAGLDLSRDQIEEALGV